jgi:membrane protein
MRPLALARQTVGRAWNDRILGLAAEAGFWQLLSLPPLLLAVLGTIGYVGDAVGRDTTASIRDSVLRGASDLLTPSIVADVVRPTVDEIIFRGRPDVISIGFLLSLWSGSSAMATYVNTITIAYGQRELRSAVRSRLLALRLYVAQVITGVVLLPALVLGPDLIARLLDSSRHHLVGFLLTTLFWPVVGLLSLTILTSLYHLSPPIRTKWRGAMPGALFAMALWVVGSYLLRMYLELVFGNELVYGSLGAPVAALLFFYITALAVLLGAELNAALYDNARARAGAGTTPAGEPAGRPSRLRRWRRSRAGRGRGGARDAAGHAETAAAPERRDPPDPRTVPLPVVPAPPPLPPAAPAPPPPSGGSVRA